MNNIANIITNIAPTIATALGGPFAGTAVSALCNVFGLKPEEITEDNLNKILASYPDKVMELKTKELQFQEELTKLQIQQEDINAKDRDSARKLNEILKSHMPNILAILNISGYFLVFYFLIFQKVDFSNTRDMAMMMIGALIANYDRIVTYYFGTTNDTLHNSLSKGDLNATRK